MSYATVRRSSPLNAALWMGAGAAAGVLVGVLLAKRFPGRRTLGDRLTGLMEGVDRWTATFVPADDADDEIDEEEEPEDGDAGEAEPAAEYDEYGADDDEAPTIDARVLAAFEQDPILSQRAIEIDEPEPAMIVLTGRVPSAGDAAHAVIIARGTPGVDRVVNRLRVRAPRDAR